MNQLIKVLNTLIGTFLIMGVVWYFMYISPTNQNYNQEVTSNLKNKSYETQSYHQSSKTITHKENNEYYKTETIPKIYYTHSTPQDQFYNILNTDKKVIVIFCPEKSYMTKFFLSSFEKKLAKNPNRNFYYYFVYKYDDNYQYKCVEGGPYCAPRYLLEACTDKLCIINPSKRQNIILKRLNPDLAMKLIDDKITW